MKLQFTSFSALALNHLLNKGLIKLKKLYLPGVGLAIKQENLILAIEKKKELATPEEIEN